MVYLQERTDRYALFIFGKKGEALPYHAFILHVLVNNRSEWTDLFFPHCESFEDLFKNDLNSYP